MINENPPTDSGSEPANDDAERRVNPSDRRANERVGLSQDRRKRSDAAQQNEDD